MGSNSGSGVVFRIVNPPSYGLFTIELGQPASKEVIAAYVDAVRTSVPEISRIDPQHNEGSIMFGIARECQGDREATLVLVHRVAEAMGVELRDESIREHDVVLVSGAPAVSDSDGLVVIMAATLYVQWRVGPDGGVVFDPPTTTPPVDRGVSTA